MSDRVTDLNNTLGAIENKLLRAKNAALEKALGTDADDTEQEDDADVDDDE